MIAEFSIIPDVFDPTGYSSPEICDLRLSHLKECLLARGVVRNLHGGEWWRHVENNRDRWHSRGKELLKKLKQQGRLREFVACLPKSPTDARGWCQEALESHKLDNLQGIIADDDTASANATESIVSSISKLGQAQWWQGAGNSIELRRTSADYVRTLSPVLKHSNSLMFIDAHLDPSERRYQDFAALLRACGIGMHKPVIEIHRVCYIGSGANRRILSEAEFRQMFEATLRPVAVTLGLHIEVFIWDDFHDRFLISNLMGVVVPNGFDVDMGPPSVTRWARLDSKDRDNVQREFDPAARQHVLRHRFTI